MSERGIQTIKKLLRKAFEDGNDPYIALLEFRNTPVSGLKEFPVQQLLKSKLPTTVSPIKPQVAHNAYHNASSRKRRDKKKMYYDRNAKPLPELQPHETLRIRMGNSWEPATVTAQYTTPGSYIVSTPDGCSYRHDR